MALPPRDEAALRDPAAAPRDPAAAWYRQGIVWLGAAVFAASIAGSLWLIAVAERYVDPPLPVDGARVLKVPVASPARAPLPAAPAPQPAPAPAPTPAPQPAPAPPR